VIKGSNKGVKHFILNLFDQGYTKEQVEARVIEYFKLNDKKKDKKIAYANRQLDSLKRHNYRAHTSQAHKYSEKAEVESIFLEGVEEVKKDIGRKISTKMAMDTGQKTEEYKIARLSQYMNNPTKILLE
jgi:hypothetical protein